MTSLVYIYLVWSAIAKFVPALGSAGQFVDGAVALIPLVLLVDMVFYRKALRFSPYVIRILWAIGAVIVVSGLSMVINRSPSLNGIRFLYSILRIILAFLWIITSGQGEEISHFTLRFLQFLVVLQIPFFIYGFLSNGRSYVGDLATGAIITGGAYEVATYMFFGSLVAIGMFRVTRERKYLWYTVGSLLLLLVTSTKQIAILTPFVILFILYRFERVRVARLLVLVIVGGMIFLLGYHVVEIQWGLVQESLSGSSDEGEPLSFVEVLAASEKAQGYYDAFVTVPGQLPFPLLGAGPGNYASFTAMNAKTPLAEAYINTYLERIPEGFFGTLVSRTSGVISLYGDIGPIGLVLMFFIYSSVLHNVGKVGWISVDLESRALAFVGVGAGLLLFAESILLNVFEGNSILLTVFWVASGSILSCHHHRNHTEAVSSSENRRTNPLE